MASSVLTSVPMWLTGCTYDGDGGDDLRNSGVTALLYPLGPASGTSAGAPTGVLGTGLKVTAASGMSVNVGGGSFAVSSPTAANGGYIACLATEATLTIAGSDPSDSRIDLICCTVVDVGNSGSYGVVQVIEGTPVGSGPTPPATPAASTRLAYVAVGAGVTSIISGNISDQRSYTCAVGGIVPQPIDFAPAGYNGAYGYDLSTDRLYHNAASGVRQTRTLPAAPVHELVTTTPVGGNTLEPVLSAEITLDGQTDIMVTANIQGVTQTSGGSLTGGYLLQATVLVDSGTIGETITSVNFDGTAGGGCQAVAYTSSAASNTPSAGVHTITLKAGFTPSSGVGSSNFTTSGSFGYLRVEPVGL